MTSVRNQENLYNKMELMFPVSSGVQRQTEHEVRQETDWDRFAIIYHNVEHVLAQQNVD
jgi:hypothetical protein